MNKKTIRDVDLKGKRVLVRVDFNVPVKEGKVADDTRIEAAVPTIKAILAQKPKSVILMSHLGRPKGEPDPQYSLKPTVPVLASKLGVDVAFCDSTVGEAAQQAVDRLPDGGVIIMENTRFLAGETKNDLDLAQQMAKLGDVYVNDAFGSAHRAHSSTEGVARYLPAVAGLLMEKEIEFLGTAIEDPQRPFVAIMGGAKISDKIGVIENLLTKADKILIGGGMANTFFAAQGIKMGDRWSKPKRSIRPNRCWRRPGANLSCPSTPSSPMQWTRARRPEPSLSPTACPTAGASSTSALTRSSCSRISSPPR